MATGRSRKLVRRTGEYLVAAELSRRGLIATTSTGDASHYDIIASDEQGRHASIQVKASSGASWQFSDISRFCTVTFEGRRQVVGRSRQCPVMRLVVVLVSIQADGADRFYILTWQTLRDMLVKSYKGYLAERDGVRAERWDSLHCGIAEKPLKPYRDDWEVIDSNLR